MQFVKNQCLQREIKIRIYEGLPKLPKIPYNVFINLVFMSILVSGTFVVGCIVTGI